MTESSSRWQRFVEPVSRTLIRNVAIAVAVAAIVALVRRDSKLFPSIAVLALWPSLGGHIVEIAFLNFVRSRIPEARLWQVAVRLAVWFVGGCALYLGMFATARALSLVALPIGFLPWGGLGFIGVELVAHASMAVRGLPNFYSGRG